MTGNPDHVADWTTGAETIAFQSCPRCNGIWYFRRAFCPRCGNDHPTDHRASGHGAVYAKTVVTRAPTPELRSLAPYCILLIEAAEGFRLMAHGDATLEIGDAVAVQFRPLGERLIPYFSKRDT
jgi:uncharacterized protein